jgi:hypothetical protein
MNKRGFAAILIVLIIVVVLAAAGGVWYWKTHSNPLPINISVSQIAPHIDSLSPSFDLAVSQFGNDTSPLLAPPALVTIHGSGFAPTGNTVNFIYGPISGLTSTNGNTITFNFSRPADYLKANCAGLTVLEDNSCAGMPIGDYPISVTNASGTSNEVPFNVTSTVPANAVFSTIDITIPATSTSLVAIPQDPYDLFMAPASVVAARNSYYGYGFSGTYLNDGTIQSGSYAGYDRVLFNYSTDCGPDGCGSVSLLFATKDYQSFILDNDTPSQSSLNTLANFGVYLNAAKIVDQSPITSVFRENIATNNVEFVNSGDYSTSSALSNSTSITSPVQGLSFFYSQSSLPGGTTSSDFSAAQNEYMNTVNTYVAGLSSGVEAEDGAGIRVSYTLSIFPPYGENIFDGIASGTIFSSYGGEGCYQDDPWYVLKNVSDGDLASVGTTQYGAPVYSLKDPNHPLNQAAYYSEVSSVQNFSAMNDNVPAPSFNDFVAKHPILIVKDPFGRLLAIDENEYTYVDGSDCGGKKPVIYLYPQKPTKVAVQFAAPIDLTLSIPSYANEWNVLAQPNGMLQDLQPQFTDCGAIDSTALGSEYAQTACEKNDYPYLYWAGYIGHLFPHLNEGWVIPQSGIRAFLEKELTAAGLDQKEKDDMISYWVPELSGFGASYYRLSFLQTDQMNALVPLNITPRPDTEFRIFLLWSPLTGMPSVQPTPQVLQSLVRNGFTVVEWGGGEQ